MIAPAHTATSTAPASLRASRSALRRSRRAKASARVRRCGARRACAPAAPAPPSSTAVSTSPSSRTPVEQGGDDAVAVRTFDAPLSELQRTEPAFVLCDDSLFARVPFEAFARFDAISELRLERCARDRRGEADQRVTFACVESATTRNSDLRKTPERPEGSRRARLTAGNDRRRRATVRSDRDRRARAGVPT